MRGLPLKGTLWLVLVSGWVIVNAQKEDYNWLMGYDSAPRTYDSTCNCSFGITKFDFTHMPVNIAYDSLGINFNFANSSISDSTGKLLFCSNGVKVYNGADELIQNGDSLGWGPILSTFYPEDYYEGEVYVQMQLIFQNPKSDSIYDVFYLYIDTGEGGNVVPDKLLRAKVNMNANGGKGKVLEKDVAILDVVNDCIISATRHGNGKDWWLCINETQSNCHDLLLYDGSDSLSLTRIYAGTTSPEQDLHSCRFSTDGRYYVTTNDLGVVDVFNFDRCSGAMSLKEEFNAPEMTNPSWPPVGIEFSPDDKFLYIFCSIVVTQYDLTANPIAASKDTIGVYPADEHLHSSDYYWGQLAPDGKIYVSSGSSSYYMALIDSPNEKGSLCGFRDHGLHIPSFIMGAPYYPNYRLGALDQGQCDSLSSITQVARDAKEKILKVYPNPATDYIVIDYGFTDWSLGPVGLQICNELGQAVYLQQLPMYSGYQKIDVSSFSAGVYTAYIMRGNGVVAAQKFVK